MFFIFCFLHSCSLTNNSKKNEGLSNKVDSLYTFANDFRLDYIYPIPEVVLYGGGSFTYDSTENSPKKHIFLSNLSEDTAIISLKGRLYYLSYDSIRSLPRYNDSIKVTWKGDGLFVVLKLKVLDETGDEINCTGVLEIVTNQISKKFEIHGGYTD